MNNAAFFVLHCIYTSSALHSEEDGRVIACLQRDSVECRNESERDDALCCTCLRRIYTKDDDDVFISTSIELVLNIPDPPLECNCVSAKAVLILKTKQA